MPSKRVCTPAPVDAGDCSTSDDGEVICRLCWGGADQDAGGRLLAPCGCQGSVKYIHERCLYDWLRTRQGMQRRSMVCELCKQPYHGITGVPSAHGSPRLGLRRLAQGMARALVGDLAAASWPLLALRLWRGYVLAAGAVEAAKLGAAGFQAGLACGKRLIEEQSAVLAQVLLSMNTLLGSPYAELLWCQAVGALVVGMLSELVYTSVLGLLAGMTFGFCSGYAGAVRASLALVSRCGVGVAGAVGCLVLRHARGLAQRLPLLRRVPAWRRLLPW